MNTTTTGTGFCSQCGRSFPVTDLVTIAGTPVCAQCKPLLLRRLQEGQTAVYQFRYKGFWIRFLAKLIDWIILGIADAVIFGVLGGLAFVNRGGMAAANPGFFFFSPLFFLARGLGFLVTLAYNTLMLGKYGATVGKMAIGAKVINVDGTPIDYGRAALRTLAEILSAMILLIGYIMAAFDDRKRALHDRIVGTLVVAG